MTYTSSSRFYFSLHPISREQYALSRMAPSISKIIVIISD